MNAPRPDVQAGTALDATVEVERLRALRLDERTAVRQRRLMRLMVGASVALVVTGQTLAWGRKEPTPTSHEMTQVLRELPSGHALMMVGLLVGVATPLARALLLARWFAGRGERVMVWVSALLVAILLSGLLLKH